MAAPRPTYGSTFFADSPVWMVANSEKLLTRGMPFAITKFRCQVGPFVPVFTDQDLAERFIKGASAPDNLPVPVADSATLRTMLVVPQKAGAQWVGLDPTYGANRRLTVQIHPIGEFIADARRCWESADTPQQFA